MSDEITIESDSVAVPHKRVVVDADGVHLSELINLDPDTETNYPGVDLTFDEFAEIADFLGYTKKYNFDAVVRRNEVMASAIRRGRSIEQIPHHEFSEIVAMLEENDLVWIVPEQKDVDPVLGIVTSAKEFHQDTDFGGKNTRSVIVGEVDSDRRVKIVAQETYEPQTRNYPGSSDYSLRVEIDDEPYYIRHLEVLEGIQ